MVKDNKLILSPEQKTLISSSIKKFQEKFEKTPEYKWLLKNAKRYGFYLSYPRNNPDGITFEPWHWHYAG